MKREQATGAVSLTFRKRDSGKTYIAEQYFKIPMQIMPPHYQDEDGTAFVYLLNTGGGVLQNDRFLTELTLEKGSRAMVTTPSTNKLYRMEDGHAVMENNITLADDAVLEYMPEHNVPFADSKAYQTNNFYLSSASTLIAMDMVTAGRVSRGEIFDYGIYTSGTRIYVDGKLKVYDNCRIEPGKMRLESLGIMEEHLTNGTIYVYSDKVDDELIQQLNDYYDSKSVCFAAGRLEDKFVIIRFTGGDTIELREVIQDTWGIIRRKVLDKDAVRIRKY